MFVSCFYAAATPSIIGFNSIGLTGRRLGWLIERGILIEFTIVPKACYAVGGAIGCNCLDLGFLVGGFMAFGKWTEGTETFGEKRVSNCLVYDTAKNSESNAAIGVFSRFKGGNEPIIFSF